MTPIDYLDRDDLLARGIDEADVDLLLRDTPPTGDDGRPVVEAERLPHLLEMLRWRGGEAMSTATAGHNGFTADARSAIELYLRRGLVRSRCPPPGR